MLPQVVDYARTHELRIVNLSLLALTTFFTASSAGIIIIPMERRACGYV